MKWHQPISKGAGFFTSAAISRFFTALLDSVQSLIDCESNRYKPEIFTRKVQHRRSLMNTEGKQLGRTYAEGRQWHCTCC